MKNSHLIIIVVIVLILACIIGVAVAFMTNLAKSEVNVTVSNDNNTTTNITDNITENVTENVTNVSYSFKLGEKQIGSNMYSHDYLMNI